MLDLVRREVAKVCQEVLVAIFRKMADSFEANGERDQRQGRENGQNDRVPILTFTHFFQTVGVSLCSGDAKFATPRFVFPRNLLLKMALLANK